MELSTDQVSFIIDRINKLIEPPKDLYEKLIELVQSVTEVNTKSVLSQEELKKAIGDEAIPAINLIAENQNEMLASINKLNELELKDFIRDIKAFLDNDDFNSKALLKNLNILLTGEDYNLMKLIKKFNFIANVMIFVFGLATVVLTVYGVYGLFHK